MSMTSSQSSRRYLAIFMISLLSSLSQFLSASDFLENSTQPNSVELWDTNGLSGFIVYSNDCLTIESLGECRIEIKLPDSQEIALDRNKDSEPVNYLGHLRQTNETKMVQFSKLPITQSNKPYFQMRIQVGSKETEHLVNFDDDIYGDSVKDKLQHVIALSLQSDFMQLKHTQSNAITRLHSPAIMDSETIIELLNYYSLGFRNNPDTGRLERVALVNCGFRYISDLKEALARAHKFKLFRMAETVIVLAIAVTLAIYCKRYSYVPIGLVQIYAISNFALIASDILPSVQTCEKSILNILRYENSRVSENTEYAAAHNDD